MTTYIPIVRLANGKLGDLPTGDVVAGAPSGIDGIDGTDGMNGGAISISYVFSTTTTDSDPGSGVLRLDNASQSSATNIYADLADSGGGDWTTVLDTFDDSTNTVKGSIRLVKIGDATKWLTFNVTAVTTASGYRKIAIANTGASASSPFSNGEAVLLCFDRAGDKGADGVSGGITLLEQHTASSGDATMDFTSGISSSYDEYDLHIIGFIPATNSVQLTLRVMTGSPAAADSGSNYRWANNRTSDAGANTATGSTGGTSFDITGGSAVNTSTKVYHGVVRFSLPQNTSVHKPFYWDCVFSGASNAVVRSEGAGVYQATTALTGIRLLFSSGNIAAGTARLYGVAKS